MLKLMIVDDEVYTRKCLQHLIAWNEFEIDDVKIAKDGVEALKLSEKFNVDILICDVRMPKMNGIELATNIRKRFPSCKIIFLSGFADKEYLKSAISLNALCYIEKPIDIDELKLEVTKAVNQLKGEMKEYADSLELKEKISQSMPLVQNEIVLKLIKENQDIERIFNTFPDSLPQFPLSGIFQCASIKYNAYSINGDKKNTSRYSSVVARLFKQFCTDNHKLLIGFRPEQDEIILISYSKNLNHSAKIDALFSNVFYMLLTDTDKCIHVSMGIGRLVKDIHQIHLSYLSAVETAKQIFYSRYSTIFRTISTFRSELPHEEEYQNKFREIIQKNPDSIDSFIKKCVSHIMTFKDIEPSRVKKFFSGLLLESIYTADKMMLLDSSYKMKLPEILDQLLKSRTIFELSDLVLENISYVFDTNSDESVPNRKVQEAIMLVNKYYSNPTLTLQIIANKMYINPNYLSTLFKKVTGKNLNVYINEVRVEHAKRLLTDSSIKMYEVAEHTGFSDPNYFATIFKKYVGYSPSQYRNMLTSKK